MKQFIARLRARLRNVRRGFFESPVVILIEEEAVELGQLLDRLEKLEAVVEAAKYVVPGMIEDYGPDQSDMTCLRTALAALEAEKGK